MKKLITFVLMREEIKETFTHLNDNIHVYTVYLYKIPDAIYRERKR